MPLGRRREYIGGFPHEVSATDTWCMLVGSCLQCRGASEVWFVNHWWHLTSSTLISVWPCCTPEPWSTNTWCSASDGGYIRRQKGQLEKTAGSPSQRLVQQSLGGFQRSTANYAVAIWDLQRSRSGATVTQTTWRRWWRWRMKDFVSKMEGKIFFQGTYRLSGTGVVECLKIIDVWCNWNSFDAFFILRRKRKCRRKRNIIFSRKTKKNESHLCVHPELSYGLVANITFSAQRNDILGTKTKNKTKNEISFSAENAKSRKWPYNPFSAPKTNFGRLLVW